MGKHKKNNSTWDEESFETWECQPIDEVYIRERKSVSDAGHDPPWEQLLTHENKLDIAGIMQSDDPSCNIQLGGDTSIKLVEALGDSGNFISLHVPTSPEASARFNKIIIGKSNSTENARACTFSYYHTQTLLAQYILRRIGNEVYTYQPKSGNFKLLNDNELKTLIRKGFDAETQCRLSKFEVADIMERLQTEPTIVVSADFFDSNEYLINFLNGTLDLHTHEFHPHSPDFHLTSLLLANYEPNYVLEGSVFADYLSEITEDNERKASHLQEITGYNLSAISGIKKATVANGPRHSGKSTYERVFQGLLGPENVSNFSLSALNNRFTLGKLLTKKVNIFGERGVAVLKDVEVFKALTGGDWNETENKGKDFINRPSKAKLIFAGNSLPTFENADDSEAFMDRITLFIFSHTIEAKKRIPDMDNRLLKESDLIASWAMDGLRRLINNSFIFTEADDAKALRRSRMSQVSSIEDFINEHCILQANARVFSRDLYHSYLDYCRMNAFKALEQTMFTGEMIAKTEGKGPVHKKIRIGKEGPYFGFINLGLKENYNPGSTPGTTEQNSEI